MHFLLRCVQDACPLDGDNLIVLFTLDNVGENAVYENNRELREMIQNYEGGEFSLFFTNCEPLSAVSFDLQARPLMLELSRHHLQHKRSG